jgi:hypothetical protein
MSQTILLHPKGGSTGVVCKCYVHLHKIKLMEECMWLRPVHILSLCGAARALGIPHSLLIKWKATLLALQAAHGKSCHSIDKGHTSQLDSVKEELIEWIFARWEQGIAVMKSQVVFKAFAELHSFGVKSFEACFKSASCFLGQHNYVYCLKTNEATCPPHEVYVQVYDFLVTTRPLLIGPHRNKVWCKPG